MYKNLDDKKMLLKEKEENLFIRAAFKYTGWLERRPGFFAPLKSGEDVFITLVGLPLGSLAVFIYCTLIYIPFLSFFLFMQLLSLPGVIACDIVGGFADRMTIKTLHFSSLLMASLLLTLPAAAWKMVETTVQAVTRTLVSAVALCQISMTEASREGIPEEVLWVGMMNG